MEFVSIKKIKIRLNRKMMEKQKKRHLVIDYDQEADVLYLSFDLPQKADETEFFSDDILIRKKSNKVVGLTLLNFKKKLLS
jgi:uncharacterized protein YuzE